MADDYSIHDTDTESKIGMKLSQILQVNMPGWKEKERERERPNRLIRSSDIERHCGYRLDSTTFTGTILSGTREFVTQHCLRFI